MNGRQTEKRRLSATDILRGIGNSLVAMLKGQFLLRLRIDKYFLQIAWTFILFALFILFGLGVDVTLAKVEKNKKELQELEVLYTQRRYELVSLSRRSTVASSLKEKGSKVTEPESKPVTLE